MLAQLIDKQFEYNVWANGELLAFCTGLTDEQLATTLAGTAGTIRDTLAHLVSAEGAYIRHLTGQRPWADDLDWGSLSVQTLHEMVLLSGNRLLELASKADPMRRTDTEYEGGSFYFFDYTIVTQAFYHGVEHRTQVKMMLTQLGIEHPELSMWDFTGMITGQD